MPLSTTSPEPLRTVAATADSVSASGRLRGRPRARRMAQYVQVPAQPSCTLITARVRARGRRVRGSASAGGRLSPQPAAT